MTSQHTKSNIISSLFWKLMERGAAQGIQLAVQIVLARVLAPEQFGTIAIVMVFVNLAQVFVQSGFSMALIQKKDADSEDFSSVFYLSLAVAVVSYVIIFICAPYIAKFYAMPVLEPVLRVLALNLFAGAFNSVQNAFVARNLLFKKLFMSSLGAVLISGTLGVACAYRGFGIWAIVIQQLANQAAVTAIMWFTVRWRPELMFSFTRVRELFAFGSRLLISKLIETLYRELSTLIIGRMYMSDTLGYYSRGQLFPQLVVSNIDGSIQSVMLPALSAHQDNQKRVKEMMRRAVVSSSFIVFPMMIGMAAVAEPLVRIVLTDKWLPAVPFMQIFCFLYILTPVHTANLQAINAMGRSDVFLRLEMINKSLGIVILLMSLPFGVYAIAAGQVFAGMTASFINAWPNKELLGYSYKEQLLDILPALLISALMGAAVYMLGFLELEVWQRLAVQVICGILIYTALARLFRIESYIYLRDTIKQLVRGRNDQE